MNNGRAVVAAAGEVRDMLLDMARSDSRSHARTELADGHVRVVGALDRAIEISALAGSGERLIGSGSGRPPKNPPCDAEGCLGRLGMESFLEPQVFTHAARVKVDRETGVVRVLHVAAAHDSGTIVNRIGAKRQVYGGVVMGIGQALLEVSQLDADGRQRNPHLLDYKLVTAADAPASMSPGSRRRPKTVDRWGRRASASLTVPTPEQSRTRSRKSSAAGSGSCR